MTDLMNKLAAVVAAASLAITLVAAGFAACAAFPQTTEMLAGAFSGNGNPGTPFSHDELVQAAVATRDDVQVVNDDTVLFPGDKAVIVADNEVLNEVRLVFKSL